MWCYSVQNRYSVHSTVSNIMMFLIHFQCDRDDQMEQMLVCFFCIYNEHGMHGTNARYKCLAFMWTEHCVGTINTFVLNAEYSITHRRHEMCNNIMCYDLFVTLHLMCSISVLQYFSCSFRPWCLCWIAASTVLCATELHSIVNVLLLRQTFLAPLAYRFCETVVEQVRDRVYMCLCVCVMGKLLQTRENVRYREASSMRASRQPASNQTVHK